MSVEFCTRSGGAFSAAYKTERNPSQPTLFDSIYTISNLIVAFITLSKILRTSINLNGVDRKSPKRRSLSTLSSRIIFDSLEVSPRMTLPTQSSYSPAPPLTEAYCELQTSWKCLRACVYATQLLPTFNSSLPHYCSLGDTPSRLPRT